MKKGKNEKIVKIRELPEYQDYLKALLLFFDQFCRNNNIEYSVAAGTLLGAVRERDIIPWDDDLDVMMTRDNMSKLKAAMKNYHGRYFLQYLPNHTIWNGLQRDYISIHWRLLDKKASNMRYNIDIFTIDFLDSTSTQAERDLIVKKSYKFFRLSAITYSFHLPSIKVHAEFKTIVIDTLIHVFHPIFFIAAWIASPFSIKAYLKFDQQFFKKTDKGFVGFAYFLNKPFVKNDWFDGGSYQTLKFGSISIMAISNPKSFLTNFYGNFMIPPPVNERLGHVEIETLHCNFVLDDELSGFLSIVKNHK